MMNPELNKAVDRITGTLVIDRHHLARMLGVTLRIMNEVRTSTTLTAKKIIRLDQVVTLMHSISPGLRDAQFEQCLVARSIPFNGHAGPHISLLDFINQSPIANYWIPQVHYAVYAYEA